MPTLAPAGKPDPDNYPLRVHVFKNTQKSRHTRQNKGDPEGPDYLDGMGVADLFENGEPRGFQFTYNCMDVVRESGGYSTIPARWKKKEKTLELLAPEPGKPWNGETCDLKTEMRPGLAFILKNDSMAEESAAALKEWMAKHEYDPEKGKDAPVAADDGPMGPIIP